MLKTDKNLSPKRVYLYVIAAWISFVSMVMGFGILNDLQKVRSDFDKQTTLELEKINQKISINETVLEGFSAMISSMDMREQEKIRSYARQVKKYYPQIFMFEIVDMVKGADLEAFLLRQRSNNPDFEIKSFSYENDRKWFKPEKKDLYLPIVFMEPFPEESKKVLGLDIEPNEIFRGTLLDSFENNKLSSSIPFKLVEGDQAYLLLRPIQNKKLGRSFSLLVIYARSMLTDIEKKQNGLCTILYHKNFKYSDARGTLYRYDGAQRSKLEKFLFPMLKDDRDVVSEAQRFGLHRELQMGWEHINWLLLSVIFIVGILSFWMLMFYARQYHRGQMTYLENTDRYFYLANHDHLTGLANKNLFDDRFNHALAQARRKSSLLAVLFLDLNNFKMVNDSHGHEMGDKVLRRVSERLRACMREEDTLARRSGDEFIVLIENIDSKDEVDRIIEKIRAAFTNKFEIDEFISTVGISIGSAIFPEQGENVMELMAAADESMYADKSAGKS